MISEGILYNQFVDRILARDQKKILGIQQKVISDNLNKVSGNLLSCIQRHKVGVRTESGGKRLEFKYLTYLRLLEIKSNKDKGQMKLRRNLALYNRVIWGVLYNDTKVDIRIGFRRETEETIYNQLTNGQITK